MEINWEIEDGYAGGSRPQTITIPDDELEMCETDEERRELVYEYIQDDFEQTVRWVFRKGYDDPDWLFA
ncbi:MAG TPA: hypothetical protein ENI23_07465 [bacterium]|nr:hypothetical protein [bacterium]